MLTLTQSLVLYNTSQQQLKNSPCVWLEKNLMSLPLIFIANTISFWNKTSLQAFACFQVKNAGWKVRSTHSWSATIMHTAKFSTSTNLTKSTTPIRFTINQRVSIYFFILIFRWLAIFYTRSSSPRLWIPQSETPSISRQLHLIWKTFQVEKDKLQDFASKAFSCGCLSSGED